MYNHLKEESSPYLLQHAENPVQWYPWCSEAFSRAELENKPVFLSIGYSTCHWCHVMARESFENEEIAEILNRNFISIKVDREERPDIDSVYMSVCQALTGSGGWPLSIFMTAQQKPFLAGTYFPPYSTRGMAGFYELLLAVSGEWENNRQGILESAGRIFSQLQTEEEKTGRTSWEELVSQGADMLSKSFDKKNGGFGAAPKFPMPHNLIFQMLYSKLFSRDDLFHQVWITLEQMRWGGIFDQIGYGFSRYSTDAYFLAPHFEKMLYDNALLITAYTLAYQLSGNRTFLCTAKQVGEFIFREMTAEGGGFYSALDADSEGEEGRYYVWTYQEVCKVLGEEKGKSFCEHYGITEEGNFEGKNIPNLLAGGEISDSFQKEREKLYDYRKNRAPLHLDDKVLTSWNAMMIHAMTVLYRASGDEKYLSAAVRAQNFLEEELSEGNCLFAGWRRGARSVKGFLDDYACEAAALLGLYGVSSSEKYLNRAKAVLEEAQEQFADERGGYFLYGTQNADLIMKPKETYDGAIPSGNSVMAYCLVRMAQITGDKKYEKRAEKQLAFLAAEAGQYPPGHCMFLLALLLYRHPPKKITAVLAEGDSREETLKRLPFYADIKILPAETAEYKLLRGRTTYYVCEDKVCLPPSNEVPTCS